MVIRKPPSPITSTVVSSGRALATPKAVPKPRPIEAKSLVSLKWPGPGTERLGHDAQEVTRVVDQVAVGRQELLERHAEPARIDGAGRIGRLEVAGDVGLAEEAKRLVGAERPVKVGARRQRFEESRRRQPCLAHPGDVGGMPAAGTGG